MICEGWNKLQQVTLNIVKLCHQNLHIINYAALLRDKKNQLDSLAPCIEGHQQEACSNHNIGECQNQHLRTIRQGRAPR